jgi:antitoxin (DNA-binding transcriptional repressor) of toxin-antitoxin stability system
MKFFTVRDFRTHSSEIWKKLSENHEIVITNNGKPSALMIEIDDESFEDTLKGVRQSMAMIAVNKLRRDSLKNGTVELTDEEITAEIAVARKEKR